MFNTSSIMPNMHELGRQVGAIVGDLYHYHNFYYKSSSSSSSSSILTLLLQLPTVYKNWWWNLVQSDPMHVLVETTLVIAIIYILISRTADWNEMQKRDKLTKLEEKELLRDWKLHHRKPLVPPLPLPSTADTSLSSRASSTKPHHDAPSDQVNNSYHTWSRHFPPQHVVHAVKGRTLLVETDAYNNNHNNNMDGTTPTKPTEVLNFATMDFLGRSVEPTMQQTALKALDKYGCGACGPRGFYGTVDVHLALEKCVAEHCQVDDAILYSDGASTVTSTVAAFCKRGDLLVVDEAIYEPLMTGVTLSRANVKWFRHNDMKDLRRVLEEQQKQDKKYKRKSNLQRRFLVVEGLYKNTGSIAKLDEIVKLKHEFAYRLILDESLSFGVLGKTGRGVAELYHQKLMKDVEITTISLENAVGSIGGVTIGTEEVVDHQRLSGSGYCFSAASPPFTATAAMESIRLMEDKPSCLTKLHENVQYMLSKLQELCSATLEDVLVVNSDPRSPLIMLCVADIPETKNLNLIAFLGEVAQECLIKGVALVATGQDMVRHNVRMEPPAALRLTVLAVHTKADMDKAVEVLGKAVDVVLHRIHEEQEKEARAVTKQ